MNTLIHDPHASELSKTVTITRLFDAPLALVWQAFTDPELLKQWWAPEHFDVPVCEVDLRPGGQMLLQMRSPDGQIMPMSAVYDEILPMQTLAFTSRAVEDEQGVPGLVGRNVLSFSAEAGKTRVELVASATCTPQWTMALAGMEMGWSQSFDKLARVLQAA